MSEDYEMQDTIYAVIKKDVLEYLIDNFEITKTCKRGCCVDSHAYANLENTELKVDGKPYAKVYYIHTELPIEFTLERVCK
jgi:hypothetical protein